MPRKRVKGYTDFGSIRIPFLPQYCIMTDREDGKLWYLSHNSDGTRFALNDAIPTTPDTVIFGPIDGPYLPSDGRIRLLIRDGRLGFELLPFDQGVNDRDQMRIMSRRGVENVQREIIVPSIFTESGPNLILAFEDNVVL